MESEEQSLRSSREVSVSSWILNLQKTKKQRNKRVNQTNGLSFNKTMNNKKVWDIMSVHYFLCVLEINCNLLYIFLS